MCDGQLGLSKLRWTLLSMNFRAEGMHGIIGVNVEETEDSTSPV